MAKSMTPMLDWACGLRWKKPPGKGQARKELRAVKAVLREVTNIVKPGDRCNCGSPNCYRTRIAVALDRLQRLAKGPAGGGT